MTLKTTKVPGKKFPRPPSLGIGVYPTRLVQIVDLGLQAQRPYKGEDKEPAYMIRVTYEFLDEFMKDEDGNDVEDKPRWLAEEFPLYPLTADKAKSTQRYLALDPTQEHDGDWSKIVGTPSMLTLVHGANKDDPKNPYENIASISSMRSKEAANAPELKNPPKVFTLDEPDLEIFGSLPQFIQDKVKNNLNFEGSLLEKLLSGEKTKDKKEEVKYTEHDAEEKEEEGDW